MPIDGWGLHDLVQLVKNVVSGNEVQVDVISSVLPVGGATAVNQAAIIGHVDGVEGLLTSIAATLAVISGSTPVVTPVTGAGAISTNYAPAVAFWLHSITLKLSAAPTTSENFVVTLDASDGVTYDVPLVSEDLSVGSVTSLVYQPDGGPLLCEANDAIDVAWTNTDGRTYGLRIVTVPA